MKLILIYTIKYFTYHVVLQIRLLHKSYRFMNQNNSHAVLFYEPRLIHESE